MTENARKPPYDAARIETERQAAWIDRGDYDAPAPPADGEHGVYVKSSSPFTSGNLHMGHVRDYTIGDAYARFQRARGRDVLMGFGFDAFGLPAELAAIERQIPAAEWVEQCGERMLEQMKRLGYSFDYDRVFYSSDEGQYKWSQWLFLTLYDMGLIYLDDATVDWCDTCQTTLATIQVEEGGTCWRCHNEVRLIRKADLVPEDHALTSRRTTPTWRSSSSSRGTTWRSPRSASSSAAPTGSSSRSTGPTGR